MEIGFTTQRFCNFADHIYKCISLMKKNKLFVFWFEFRCLFFKVQSTISFESIGWGDGLVPFLMQLAITSIYIQHRPGQNCYNLQTTFDYECVRNDVTWDCTKIFYHEEIQAWEVRARSNMHTLSLSAHRNLSNWNMIERIYHILLQNQKWCSYQRN